MTMKKEIELMYQRRIDKKEIQKMPTDATIKKHVRGGSSSDE